MKDYNEDSRVVLTLDAGGTNFVFSAIKGNEVIFGPVSIPSEAHDLRLCLNNIVKGFRNIRKNIAEKPVAISFAFPGPADYPRGIIGKLPNLPAFSEGGVPLGSILEKEFNLPVFINNDGNLFAYGEAISGFLPYLNKMLADGGSPKRFNNLIGVTLGTGFGGGLVVNKELVIGDNSNAGEVWLLRNKLFMNANTEDSISTPALRNKYAAYAEVEEMLTPKEIYEVAIRKRNGNRDAAIRVFAELAIALGDALANVTTLIDGPVVLGGGIASASMLFLDTVVGEMNSTFVNHDHREFNRLACQVFNLEKKDELARFIKGEKRTINFEGIQSLEYDPLARIGIGTSRLGASRAIALGAYAIALKTLDNQ
ncbi:MAG: ROK family protein [Cyclobacteriaceae bacterium]|nr:ROK family protein [Cyclobacteriaceae bacterium]